MKKTYEYKVGDKVVSHQYNYIPFRYILALFMTVLEVLAVIAITVALCYFVPYFYIAAWATEIFCVIKIASSDDNPEYKVPWLLFVLILPIAGFMLYFMFYSRKLPKKYMRRLETLRNTASYSHDDSELLSALESEDAAAAGQARLLTKISDSRLFDGGRQEYFPLGEQKHKRLLSDLSTAQSFIFLEYFIIEEGNFWDSILDILKEKAKAGVEVRVVYDDIGCMSTLPGDYYKTLSCYGIMAAPFSRLRGTADGEFNNRSHRKIAVIDGKVGYTGGVNIADEYINKTKRFGHWKDVALRIEGRGVWELTRLFLLDFGVNVKALPEVNRNYFPTTDTAGKGYIVPFGDGPRPIYERRVGKSIIKAILESAERYAYITTPYLIIDNDLCESLEVAALRGVDVRIIVPHIPDKKLVFEVTRSFYPRLMKAGVRIYEYEPGFIHAKTYLADGKYAMIGTINLDYRSLVHHFECGVWAYNTEAIPQIKADFDATLAKSIEISSDSFKVGLIKRAVRSVARIFAPLL